MKKLFLCAAAIAVVFDSGAAPWSKKKPLEIGDVVPGSFEHKGGASSGANTPPPPISSKVEIGGVVPGSFEHKGGMSYGKRTGAAYQSRNESQIGQVSPPSFAGASTSPGANTPPPPIRSVSPSESVSSSAPPVSLSLTEQDVDSSNDAALTRQYESILAHPESYENGDPTIIQNARDGLYKLRSKRTSKYSYDN
ncbi:hypothetical protein FACS189449_13570 [Alphaproteobacteria bacterium]|nr:hypothetical protein FACS189449_13570 [Alphaproteobacteria bacterium]